MKKQEVSMGDRLDSLLSALAARIKNGRKVVGEVFYGMTVHEFELEIQKEKGKLGNLLMVMVVGDLAGLPIFPPYFSLRLLPHVIPYLETWKRSMLRERDLTDIMSVDI
jgi:hypothetical protein